MGAESLDESDEAVRGACLPRARVGGPGSSGSGGADACDDRLGGSPGVICALGVLSSLEAARRIVGRSESFPLVEPLVEELDELVVLSPSLDEARCRRGRSGSLSPGVLPLALDDPEPSIGWDASARSSAVPCRSCVILTAW